MLIRRIEPLSGMCRIRIRLRPLFEHGSVEPTRTLGSNHIRFVSATTALRLTTDAPISYLNNETSFRWRARSISFSARRKLGGFHRPRRSRIPGAHQRLLARVFLNHLFLVRQYFVIRYPGIHAFQHLTNQGTARILLSPFDPLSLNVRTATVIILSGGFPHQSSAGSQASDPDRPATAER